MTPFHFLAVFTGPLPNLGFLSCFGFDGAATRRLTEDPISVYRTIKSGNLGAGVRAARARTSPEPSGATIAPRSVATTSLDFSRLTRFNRARTARFTGNRLARETLMKKLFLAILLISSPAWAQTKLAPNNAAANNAASKNAAARIDNCAPIGRT